MFQKRGKWCSRKPPNGVPENGEMVFQKMAKWCSRKPPNGVPENGQMVFQKMAKWCSKKRPNGVPLFGFLVLNPSRIRGSGGVPKRLGTLFFEDRIGHV